MSYEDAETGAGPEPGNDSGSLHRTGAPGEGPRLVADHGSHKQAEPTDPLEPMASVVPGDADYLARCFVEEFAFMGYDGAAILELFRDPHYLAVHAIWRQRGDEAVRELIDEVLAESGVMRVTVETPQRSRPHKVVQIETPEDDGGIPRGGESGDAREARADGEARGEERTTPGDGRKETG